MIEKRKVWLGVGSVLLAGSVMAQPQTPPSQGFASLAVMAASTASANQGEGEGGEIENLATDDAAYLAHLGLIRGHLWVGLKLYREGHLKMAKTHMKHPEDELYAGLESVFKARGAKGFAKELGALADAVNNEKGDKAVEKAYKTLLTAIDASENIDQASTEHVLISIAKMVRTAAEEYAVGVKAGEITNVHEYQDAYGFTEITIARLENLSDAQKQQAQDDIKNAKAILLALRSQWPSVSPEGKVQGDAKNLYAAAARIELLALN